jgi:ABC-2 type transport system permease protein
MNLNVIRAIFKRNFVSYFSNPTGYVFICVFVLLVAFAAFWPNEFFNNNLANLDQLNRYLPLIMLVFIPAITMSIWSEERRQGTDELLLTIPAADFDVVIGKYLAAVAIFTVALVFSAIANWLVFLFQLGLPDTGLYLGTYFGYWMVGLAMLAVGMVASFLTGNLTVGFILGALFNAPLVFAASADVILRPEWARAVKEWSLADKFRDFGQGVISLAGVGFFVLIIAVMLYLSMVLIGRRHWMGGRDGHSMLGHYIVRAIALLAVAIGMNLLFARVQAFNRLRWDITDAKLSSLAPQTKSLLQNLDAARPVKVDAYVSPEVPEAYAQTRVNLLNTLREMDALGGDKVVVEVHETEPLSDEAANADKQFGIKGQQVASRNRGAMNVDQIFLGVAFTSGLEKVVVPFIDRGMPVEYELIRSIATVAQKERKKVGVLVTDAQLYGGFNQQTMGMTNNERIIEELEKQYEVKQVRADGPITEKFDVLLAVQPSSLSPEQMPNFINYVKSGHPTAIFEDPFPYLDPNVPGTAAPKQPPGGNNPFMMQRQPPQPKGEISPLWGMLGVSFTAEDVIWQDYNPYPSIGTIPKEFVFTGQGSGADEPFNAERPVSDGLREMLFLFPGAIRQLQASDLKFTPLVRTGPHTGTVKSGEVLEHNFLGQGGLNPRRFLKSTHENYVLACHIQGKPKANLPMDDAKSESADSKDTDSATSTTTSAKKDGEINVVLVSDIDVLYSAFFQLRARGQDEEADINLNLDNVTFVLNALDMLAGDDSFVEIRKRHPAHQTLVKFEERTGEARQRVIAAREKFIKEFNDKKEAEQKQLDEAIAKLQKQKNIDAQELLRRVEIAREAGQKRLQATTERLESERDKQIKTSELEYARETREQQNNVKFAAVIWPPILPLLMGVAVFFNRRAREREGVSKNRLR